MRELSLIEQLTHSTLRIETDVSVGTGFIYTILHRSDQSILALVTNKHVVRGCSFCKLRMTISKDGVTPEYGSYTDCVVLGNEAAWVNHPDPNIDLCMLPLGNLINEQKSKGINVFIKSFSKGLLPSIDDIDDFIGAESVLMVGYPDGLWDITNNQPIFRAGTVASNYRCDWNGRPEFLIDCACFNGSSGSPVLICDIGHYSSKSGSSFGADRVKLLGILYAGPQHSVDGSICVDESLGTTKLLARSAIPNNLGYVLKSRLLNDFEPIIAAMAGWDVVSL